MLAELFASIRRELTAADEQLKTVARIRITASAIPGSPLLYPLDAALDGRVELLVHPKDWCTILEDNAMHSLPTHVFGVKVVPDVS